MIGVLLWMSAIAGPILYKWNNLYPAFSHLMGIHFIVWCVFFGVINSIALKLVLRDAVEWKFFILSFLFGAIFPAVFEWWVSWRSIILNYEIIGLLLFIALCPILIYAIFSDRKKLP